MPEEHPSFVPGLHIRQRLSPLPLTSTQTLCLPSLQSPLPVQVASGKQAPVAPQSGPAEPGAVWHSASVEQAVHAFDSQIGVVGTSAQPPVDVQSTHLCAVVSHLSFFPEQPASLTQSTHVAVVGSH